MQRPPDTLKQLTFSSAVALLLLICMGLLVGCQSVPGKGAASSTAEDGEQVYIASEAQVVGHRTIEVALLLNYLNPEQGNSAAGRKFLIHSAVIQARIDCALKIGREQWRDAYEAPMGGGEPSYSERTDRALENRIIYSVCDRLEI